MSARKSVLAVLQARMGSTRLPGKMMADLGGRPVLGQILERLKGVRRIDHLVVATSISAGDDPIEDLAGRHGVEVYRGPEDDVLARFAGVFSIHPADYLLRLCGDNPFLAPEALDILVDFILDDPSVDYAVNVADRDGSGWPDGLGGEIVKGAVFERVARETTEPRHREHVLTAVGERPDRFVIRHPRAPKVIAFPSVKLDLDTEEDLMRIRGIVSLLHGPPDSWRMEDIVSAAISLFPDPPGPDRPDPAPSASPRCDE